MGIQSEGARYPVIMNPLGINEVVPDIALFTLTSVQRLRQHSVLQFTIGQQR